MFLATSRNLRLNPLNLVRVMPAKGKIKSIFLLPAFPPHFLMVKQKKMKRIFLALLFLHTHAAFSQSKQNRIDSLPADSFYMLAPASVRAVRADENAPFSKSNLTKKDINLLNQGVDLPSVLGSLPSVVIHSDAGNGIGYTGLRIRGTDATRINITLNGIPFNDAESQGTFFVNLPDFISSASSIQVQRGVGTSSNGAGAFGASVNISTLEREKEKYIELKMMDQFQLIILFTILQTLKELFIHMDIEILRVCLNILKLEKFGQTNMDLEEEMK